MKTNPAKNGFLCNVFTINSQSMREEVGKMVVIAGTREEASAIVNKSLKYDPKLKFTLDHIMVFS